MAAYNFPDRLGYTLKIVATRLVRKYERTLALRYDTRGQYVCIPYTEDMTQNFTLSAGLNIWCFHAI